MRMTKKIKEELIANYKKDNTQERTKQLSKTLTDEFRSSVEKNELYEDILTLKENKHLSGYFSEFSYVSLDWCSLSAKFKAIIGNNTLTVTPYASKNRYSAKSINMVGYKDIINTHYQKLLDINKEVDDLLLVINSCTTIKKLVDILPEVEKYLPEISKSTVMVDQSVLNRVKGKLK